MTIAEYLRHKEGKPWSSLDTEFVLAHYRDLDRKFMDILAHLEGMKKAGSV